MEYMCPAPPPERCCTRVFERPGSKLRVQFADAEVRAISSIMLWNATGGALQPSPARMSGYAISIGSASRSMTGCFLLGSASSEPPSGHQGMDIVCGATGEEVVMSFPGMIKAGESGKLAVKLCTVPAAMAGGATLWVKTA
jgi:hypothetical protein